MKLIISILMLAFLPLATMAIPAFPGAEGWGADTPGGRGGKVVIVTNLNSDGPGSLMEALRASGPRIITFRVSGVIDIQPRSQWYLQASNSYVTIAGQTSPGGITLISSRAPSILRSGLNSYFTNAIFRFIRLRSRT